MQIGAKKHVTFCICETPSSRTFAKKSLHGLQKYDMLSSQHIAPAPAKPSATPHRHHHLHLLLSQLSLELSFFAGTKKARTSLALCLISSQVASQ